MNIQGSLARAEPPEDVETVQEATPVPAPAEWGLAKRILFRFTCAYFFLYLFPSPFDYIPFLDAVALLYRNFWQAMAAWTGRHVFGVEFTVRITGSGDTTFNYISMFCCLVLAVAATLVWSILDRKRPNYIRLHEWLRVYVRFGLGIAMVSYGAMKIIPAQFPSPSLDRLLQPYGDSSPMGLLWTFIGASKSYQIFSGAAELLGGLLLISRRTTLLGALVSFATLVNVAMLNFCYDVPVKLYSSHLLLMAVFLILPDLRRLADVLLFNRAVPPADHRPLFKRVWLNRIGLACGTLLLLGVAAMNLFSAFQSQFENKSPFYGIWMVDEFEVDGQLRPPLITDESRWWRVVFDYPGRLGVQLMDQSRQRYFLTTNPVQRSFELTKREDPKWKSALSYRQSGPEILNLEGTLDGRKIRAKIRRVPTPKFLLVERGFHWINEVPLNR